MVEWSLGTIGFTYPEWKGSFYPAGLPSGQSLNFYSKVFNAVEINTTFYGPQSPEQIQRWVASTPDDFCFCMKTPRHITHDLRLQEGAYAEMQVFVDASLTLGKKLGAFLIQLPPSFAADQIQAVEKFFEALMVESRYRDLAYAIEFRHPSWYTEQTSQSLEKMLRQFGVCWLSLDYEHIPMVIHPTANYLYLRWIDQHNVIPHPGHEVLDKTERLKEWLVLIDAARKTSPQPIEHIFGFFDNDYAGHAPATCNKLKALIGLPVTTSQGEQGRLF